MTSYAEARWLPRGWAHLAFQFALWFGFYGAYQVARGAADREVGEAFWNGTLVIEAENRLHALVEPAVQGFVQSSGLLIFATTYTYWLSQFAVVGVTLLWVYFRHHDRFADFRNWLIGANLIGLLGYVLMGRAVAPRRRSAPCTPRTARGTLPAATPSGRDSSPGPARGR